MGFLLGKINEALQEFETTNQEPSTDDGGILVRSINRSATSYQFREKDSWSYEFQYMDNTEYQNLIYLLKNRNSLKEGMLLIPIPYSHSQNDTILLPNGTSNRCYTGYTIEGIVPWNQSYDSLIKNEISSGDYTKINLEDTNYIQITPPADGVPYYILSFDLTGFVSTFGYKELRRLTIAMMGMNSSPYRFFIWSPLNEDWYLIDDRYYNDSSAFDIPSGSGSFSLNKGLIASFSIPWGTDSIKTDFLGSDNKVKFMISADRAGQSLMIQFMRLLVNGYWVCAEGAPAIDNFSTAFTGSGRSGNVKLTEL